MKKMFLGLILPIFLPFAGHGQQIFLENSIGDHYFMEINPDESFKSVIASMEEYEPFRQELCFNFTVSKNAVFAKSIKKAHANPRTYSAGVSQGEQDDIIYIVKTLADSSLPKIKSNESSLKKAGDRIDDVHPLQFLGFVFTNEELKVCMRNLHGRSWVWKDFLKGLVESLAQEHARNNVLPFLNDFANKVKVDINILQPIVQNAKWEKLVDTMIEIIPRYGDTGRYNM